MKRESSLYDLQIVRHSQFKYGDITLPLKIDLKDVTEMDYICAVSLMNEYKIDKIDKADLDKSELEDINVINICSEKIDVSYEILEHSQEIDYWEFEDKFDMLTKFINTTDKLFYGKTFLEYYKVKSAKEFLYEIDIGEEFFNKLSHAIYFWVDEIIADFRNKVMLVLNLVNKKDTSLNISMQKLKACYDQLKIYYFKENTNGMSYEELSLREQHLILSYNTKMYNIEEETNNKHKKQMSDSTPKQPNKRLGSSSRGKY